MVWLLNNVRIISQVASLRRSRTFIKPVAPEQFAVGRCPDPVAMNSACAFRWHDSHSPKSLFRTQLRTYDMLVLKRYSCTHAAEQNVLRGRMTAEMPHQRHSTEPFSALRSLAYFSRCFAPSTFPPKLTIRYLLNSAAQDSPVMLVMIGREGLV